MTGIEIALRTLAGEDPGVPSVIGDWVFHPGFYRAVTGRSIPFCPELARALLHGHRYDGSLATRELGLKYRPVEDTIERTLRWCADRGLIRPLPTGGVP